MVDGASTPEAVGKTDAALNRAHAVALARRDPNTPQDDVSQQAARFRV